MKCANKRCSKELTIKEVDEYYFANSPFYSPYPFCAKCEYEQEKLDKGEKEERQIEKLRGINDN